MPYVEPAEFTYSAASVTLYSMTIVQPHNEMHQGAKGVIYAIELYTVDTRDTSAFSAAFEDGPWQHLTWQQHGHLHTGLHLQSAPPTMTFLMLGIWKAESDYLNAQDTPEIRQFHRLLKLLSSSYERMGAFRYQYPRVAAEIPVCPSARRPVRTSVPKAS